MSDQVTPMSDVGINDVELGAELFSSLRMSVEDLTFPGEFSKVKEVVEFLNKIEDPIFFLRKAVRGKQNQELSNLDHLLDIVRLNKEEIATTNKLAEIRNELNKI